MTDAPIPEGVVERVARRVRGHEPLPHDITRAWDFLRCLDTADLCELLLAREGVEVLDVPQWTVYGGRRVCDHSPSDRLLIVPLEVRRAR